MEAKEIITALFNLMKTEVDINDEFVVGTKSTINITEAKEILNQYEKEKIESDLLKDSIIACAELGEYPAMIHAAEKLNIKHPRYGERKLSVSIHTNEQGSVAVKQI